mmetsp:Transcript_14301/g.36286  ORF Transcript_14301/g.36286 Transcript_14301/m.36286 type:complete len:294 (+) Transcript_14301:197-1078(+)
MCGGAIVHAREAGRAPRRQAREYPRRLTAELLVDAAAQAGRLRFGVRHGPARRARGLGGARAGARRHRSLHGARAARTPHPARLVLWRGRGRVQLWQRRSAHAARGGGGRRACDEGCGHGESGGGGGGGTGEGIQGRRARKVAASDGAGAGRRGDGVAPLADDGDLGRLRSKRSGFGRSASGVGARRGWRAAERARDRSPRVRDARRAERATRGGGAADARVAARAGAPRPADAAQGTQRAEQPDAAPGRTANRRLVIRGGAASSLSSSAVGRPGVARILDTSARACAVALWL